MLGAPATYTPGRMFTPKTMAGVAALSLGGLAAGAFATRAIMRRYGAGPLPALSGEAGSLTADGRDATWYVEASVGGEPTMWTWTVRSLPAGDYLDSSESEFSTADAARADLAAYGAQKGWIFA